MFFQFVILQLFYEILEECVCLDPYILQLILESFFIENFEGVRG